ncbi:MAG: D-alanyl-D-alanine carboxypeptidase, partial [Eggerthellaceae bacterium]|nr:D-alanyl-D-alanine carboxypeptidase [Eggerthellaceae bacterium]
LRPTFTLSAHLSNARLPDKKKLPEQSNKRSSFMYDIRMTRIKTSHVLFCTIADLAVMFAFAWVLMSPTKAFAEIRSDDIVMGRTVTEWNGGMDSPDIDAAFAMMIDESGRVLFDRNGSANTYIASITKVMTFIIAYENAPLDTEVVYTLEAARLGDDYFKSYVGDVMDLYTALKALMIASANSEAMVIADTVGALIDPSASNPRAAFVAAMNAKATAIGCADTVYTNPHGLDFLTINDRNAHSSCADILLIARYAMQIPLFREIVSTPAETIHWKSSTGGDREYNLVSTNPLWGVYDGIAGIKTGNTALAGPCLLTKCTRYGKTVYTVVLKATSLDGRAQDTINMLNWYFDHYSDVDLLTSQETATYKIHGTETLVSLFGYVPHKDYKDVNIPLTTGQNKLSVRVHDFDKEITQQVFFEEVRGKVNIGDVLGHVVYSQGDTVVAVYDLYALEAVSAPEEMSWWDLLMYIIDCWLDMIHDVIWGGEPVVLNDFAADDATYDKSLIVPDK